MNVFAKDSSRAYRAVMGMAVAMLVCNSVGCVHVSNVFWPNRSHPHHEIMHHSSPADAWFPNDMSAGYHATTWHKLPSPHEQFGDHYEGAMDRQGLQPIDGPVRQPSTPAPEEAEQVPVPDELPPLPDDAGDGLPSDDDLPPLPDDLFPSDGDEPTIPGDAGPKADPRGDASSDGTGKSKRGNELDFSNGSEGNSADGDVTPGGILPDEQLPIQQPTLDPPSFKP